MPPADRWHIAPATRSERRQLLGEWLVWRYRRAAAERGTQAVARQLRKQGVPVELALRVLGITPSRHDAPAVASGRAMTRPRGSG